MVVSAQSLGTMYWGMAELAIPKDNQVYASLESVISEYIDEFSLQSVANIIFSKLIKLKRENKTRELLEAFDQGMEH